MRSDLLPLSRYAVDRDGEARTHPDLLERLWVDPATRVVVVHRGLVAVTDDGAALDLLGPADLAPLAGATDGVPRGAGAPLGPMGPLGPLGTAYLGRDTSAAYVLLVLSESEGDPRDFAGLPGDPGDAVVAGRTWASLREVGALLGDRDAGLAATAVALAAWHARHPRCPRCGEPTQPVEAGWARRCETDGSMHHPRTDPAVIVAVTDDDDRLLLAHAAHWPARRFSLVAGYVEPGESLEAAARREVAEECGLDVDHVAYQASQPWPFPASLMLGFRARVAGGDLRPDGVEITEAIQVSRSDLAAKVTSGQVLLPMRASIARALIEEWFGERLPGA